MSIVEYLPCGCGIDSEGGRDYCPKCAAKLNSEAEMDKVIEEIDKILIAGHALLIPGYTPTYIRDQILNIKVGNYRLAVVEDGAELPVNLDGQPSLSRERCLRLANLLHKPEGVIAQIYAEVQQDMLKAGYVKEVKE